MHTIGGRLHLNLSLVQAAAFACCLAACGSNRTIPGHEAYAPAETPKLACMPNLDGAIDASEMEPVLDLPVSFLVSPAGIIRTDVDIAGHGDLQGNRVWSLDQRYANDQVAKLQASALARKWYAAAFPAGQFVTPIDLGGTTEAVYARDANELRLLGYASATENPPEERTLVVYSSPVALYKFPLVPGQHWTSVGEIRQQMVRSLPYAGADTYEVRVEGAGRLVLSDFIFTQALQVTTTVRIDPAVGPDAESRKQVSWIFECFGEVARATSLKNELADDFTAIAELRRLGS